MRGVDYQQSGMFSYISAEPRVPEDHPLQAIRLMADAGLKDSRGASMWSRPIAVGRRF
jgi:hypothetical protein